MSTEDTRDTITRDELVAYYKRNTAANDTPADVARAIETCEYVADKIFADVRAYREPGYEPGGVYQDAHGDVFKYCNDLAGDTPWLGFTGELYAHGYVSRPLRRLVPEGELESRLRELIAEMRGHPLAAATAVRSTVMADELEALLKESRDEH